MLLLLPLLIVPSMLLLLPLLIVPSMVTPAPVALRVLRDPVDLPVPHRRTGRAIVLDGRTNLTLLDAWKEGRIEVQDLGSQAIVDFVGEVLTGERGGLLPGARILDLCAGAGGKSLALAALGARVQAWDTRRSALDELLTREPPACHDLLKQQHRIGTEALARHLEHAREAWTDEDLVEARLIERDGRGNCGHRHALLTRNRRF